MYQGYALARLGAQCWAADRTISHPAHWRTNLTSRSPALAHSLRFAASCSEQGKLSLTRVDIPGDSPGDYGIVKRQRIHSLQARGGGLPRQGGGGEGLRLCAVGTVLARRVGRDKTLSRPYSVQIVLTAQILLPLTTNKLTCASSLPPLLRHPACFRLTPQPTTAHSSPTSTPPPPKLRSPSRPPSPQSCPSCPSRSESCRTRPCRRPGSRRRRC